MSSQARWYAAVAGQVRFQHGDTTHTLLATTPAAGGCSSTVTPPTRITTGRSWPRHYSGGRFPPPTLAERPGDARLQPRLPPAVRAHAVRHLPIPTRITSCRSRLRPAAWPAADAASATPMRDPRNIRKSAQAASWLQLATQLLQRQAGPSARWSLGGSGRSGGGEPPHSDARKPFWLGGRTRGRRALTS